MSYRGKFEGNTVCKIHVVNPTYNTKKTISSIQKKKLLKAAIKALGKRILLALGLLMAYASLFGMFLSIMLMAIRPDNVWAYLICGVSLGYCFLVVNCRTFEYIGDRMGPKW